MADLWKRYLCIFTSLETLPFPPESLESTPSLPAPPCRRIANNNNNNTPTMFLTSIIIIIIIIILCPSGLPDDRSGSTIWWDPGGIPAWASACTGAGG
ncbi:hypothetical protein CRUP_014874 [Coryphaenoides rupestris]|nr:hypothetical protein CRUP_014874 [Coryphaenoides rupestris]